MTNNLLWPESFVKGEIDHDRPKLAHCADGLTAWANCMSGHKQDEHFGKVMMQIGVNLGIIATPENLVKYADEHMPK